MDVTTLGVLLGLGSAIAYGSGDPGRIELPHVPFSADIKVGDLLVTSGIGGRFPPGLPVATVYEVQTDNSATFAVAEARPLAGIAGATELLLVSDEHNHPLSPERCDALRVALLAVLDGETA